MKKSTNFKKTDEELSQAVARAVTTVFVFVYITLSWFFTHDLATSSALVVGIYMLYSLYNLRAVAKKPGFFLKRRLFNITGDIAVTSYAMYAASTTAGVVFYPILLWIIVANGMRFGTKYLIYALAVSELFFTSALLLNNAWNGHHELVYSLSLGMIILSLAYAKIIERMHTLNETLEKKVRERVSELAYQYLHDNLTELKNREALNKDLQQENFGGLIVVDIDQFHNYNELYGMQAGNLVLTEVAGLLRAFSAQHQYDIYRVYGDHFALRSLRRFPVHTGIEEDIKMIVSTLEGHTIYYKEHDDSMKIDVTIGISLERTNALKKAEMALAYAKKKKISYIAYSKMVDTSSGSQELLVWKGALKEAIKTDNIIPVFQPIVNREQHIVKYEALMRLRRTIDGKEELVSPFYFLEIAFKSKQYATLTRMMIEKSFRFIHETGREVSINLAFEDIVNSCTHQLLKEKIAAYQIGGLVIFEIVESSGIDDFDKVKAFIEEFRALGVRIAIDDFGTGYSNFSHILELSPDFLKIDGSLIKKIDKDEKSRLLARTIITMAKEMGIKTIAEFVSSKEIFDICYELGADYFQGYYFSEPLLQERVTEFIGDEVEA